MSIFFVHTLRISLRTCPAQREKIRMNTKNSYRKSLLLLALILSLCMASLCASAQAFLHTPIEGEQSRDWIIVNYVDWEIDGFKDYRCGTKSYDGHQGTDFAIRSFAQMDSGVQVLAAAAGRVTYVQDGLYDRETEGDVTKKLGNYLAIYHSTGHFTYYGHLKKNSINVAVGDSVSAGDLIALVGSSGNSTDPHLHFEVYYDSTYIVDPFVGPCGNANTLWLTPERYDTSFGIFEYGLISQNNLTKDHLRNRLDRLNNNTTIAPSSDSSLNFWAHLYGLRAGKTLKITWHSPEKKNWFSYTVTLDKDYWYYYYWSFINHQNLQIGTWEIHLEYDGATSITQTFDVSKTATINEPNHHKICRELHAESTEKLLLKLPAPDRFLYDTYGREIVAPYTPGTYIFVQKTNQGKCSIKRHIR